MATVTLSPTASPFPYAVLVLAAYLGITAEFDYDLSEGALLVEDGGNRVLGIDEIVQALAKNASNGDSSKSSAFFALATSLRSVTAFPEIVAALESLDDHLAFRTFLVGHQISAADWAVWGSLKGSLPVTGVLKRGQQVHLSRWYGYLESLPSTQSALSSLVEAKANKAKNTKTASSFALGLPGAVEGQVVTRFPPEPSGYLHIGHAKAAMLNQYFAQMYKGKLIVRFDDTNPSKERSEFEETILEDLLMLDIKGDVVTHTSDHFDTLYKYAVQLIESGKAYADDTEQKQMQAERWDGIASKRRDSTVEENLQRFNEMKEGTAEGKRWCIRAKISYNDPNKALRDPVIYRCNDLPHHRTGTQWKVYPTYDFACPVVDTIEGVTHALRTNEYRDRNPQYSWMQEALGIRKVHVWDFSRLNFIYTLLSKRKLHWFVDNGLVRGWDDPRFPTVRGIRRRGLTVEALRQYMLAQGPSQAAVSLEWDSIWSINKKVIDPIAPRLWAVTQEKAVRVNITNGPSQPEVKPFPFHKKNPDVGTKQTTFSSTILIDQEDAASFEDQEEITLMDWGNAFVRSKAVSPEGVVTSIEMELNPTGNVKTTKKKITWLAESPSLVHVTLLDHDYLITKKKLEENDNVADFVTPVTEFRTEAFSDANVLNLKKGDIIQFERKGYYAFDGVAEDANGKRYEFVKIPDGRAAGLASKAGPATAPTDGAPKAQASGAKGWGKPAPKGKAASPSDEGAKIMLSDGSSGFEIPVTTKMYSVNRVYGEGTVETPAETKMYPVKGVYQS